MCVSPKMSIRRYIAKRKRVGLMATQLLVGENRLTPQWHINGQMIYFESNIFK